MNRAGYSFDIWIIISSSGDKALEPVRSDYHFFKPGYFTRTGSLEK
ncbi:MAG: hypothetical protein JZU70_03940 [Chlorobium sp.]|nr:hypothetical protein [Chlorobium sp.]